MSFEVGQHSNDSHSRVMPLHQCRRRVHCLAPHADRRQAGCHRRVLIYTGLVPNAEHKKHVKENEAVGLCLASLQPV